MVASNTDRKEFEDALNEIIQRKGWNYTREPSGFLYHLDTGNKKYLIMAKVRHIGQQPGKKKESSTATQRHDAIRELENLADVYGEIPVLGYRVFDRFYDINDFLLITIDSHHKHQRARSVLSCTDSGRVYNGRSFAKLGLMKNDLLAAVRYRWGQPLTPNLIIA